MFASYPWSARPAWEQTRISTHWPMEGGTFRPLLCLTSILLEVIVDVLRQLQTFLFVLPRRSFSEKLILYGVISRSSTLRFCVQGQVEEAPRVGRREAFTRQPDPDNRDGVPSPKRLQASI